MIGKTYLERGRPVVVLRRWREARRAKPTEITEDQAEELELLVEAGIGTVRLCGPRNVLIQREDGSLVVRPFRGLRRPK